MAASSPPASRTRSKSRSKAEQEQTNSLPTLPAQDDADELSSDIPTAAHQPSKTKSNDTLVAEAAESYTVTEPPIPCTSSKPGPETINSTGTAKGLPRDTRDKSPPSNNKADIRADEAQKASAPQHSPFKNPSESKKTGLDTVSATIETTSGTIVRPNLIGTVAKSKKSARVARENPDNNASYLLRISSSNILPESFETDHDYDADQSSDDTLMLIASVKDIQKPKSAAIVRAIEDANTLSLMYSSHVLPPNSKTSNKVILEQPPNSEAPNKAILEQPPNSKTSNKVILEQLPKAPRLTSTKSKSAKTSRSNMKDTSANMAHGSADKSFPDTSANTNTRNLRSAKGEKVSPSASSKTENAKASAPTGTRKAPKGKNTALNKAKNARTPAPKGTSQVSKSNNAASIANNSALHNVASSSGGRSLRSNSKVDSVAPTTSSKPVTQKVSKPATTNTKVSKIAEGNDNYFKTALKPAAPRASTRSNRQTRNQSSMASTNATHKRKLSNSSSPPSKPPAKKFKAMSLQTDSENEEPLSNHEEELSDDDAQFSNNEEPSSMRIITYHSKVPLNDTLRPSASSLPTLASQQPSAEEQGQASLPASASLQKLAAETEEALQKYFEGCTALFNETFPPTYSFRTLVSNTFKIKVGQTPLFRSANMVFIAQALLVEHDVTIGSIRVWSQQQARLVAKDGPLLADLRKFARGEDFEGVTGVGLEREFLKDGVRYYIDAITEEH